MALSSDMSCVTIRGMSIACSVQDDGPSSSDDEPLPDADNAVAPAFRYRRRELLSFLELGTAWLGQSIARQWPRGDGHPVLIVPGFLAGENSTRFLRGFLRRQGYYAHDWGLGWNLGLRDGVHDGITERLGALSAKHDRRVSLIGWSAGGIYSREVAREHPELVRDVITLGSPFRGNLRATHAWNTYKLLNRGPGTVELMATAACEARATPLEVPTTCIYSKFDGIVAWECCMSRPAPLTENVEVCSTHLGYGHNLETLYVIADRLARPEVPLDDSSERRVVLHEAGVDA